MTDPHPDPEVEAELSRRLSNAVRIAAVPDTLTLMVLAAEEEDEREPERGTEQGNE